MRYACLLLLITLSACSYTTYLSGADEHGGTVNLVTDLSKDGAIENANEHCHKYNLVARVIRILLHQRRQPASRGAQT